MAPECQDAMTALINTKLLNSAQYLALGAYFSRDSVNRIGFSDLFYINADANRDQAIELIDYIVLRGEYTSPDNILQLFVSFLFLGNPTYTIFIILSFSTLQPFKNGTVQKMQ